MSAPREAPPSPSRSSAVVFLAFAFVYLYAFPYFDRLRSANELPRVLMAQQIVEQRTFAIDARLGEMGSVFDVATTPEGRHYPNKAPGLSLLAVPVYFAARTIGRIGPADLAVSTWLFRLTVVTVPALLFLPVFFRLARRFAPPGAEASTRAALCAYALGSMMLPYALLFMSHVPAAVAVGTAFAIAGSLVRGETLRPMRAGLAVGALSGLAVLCDYQALLGAAIVSIYAFVGGRDRRRRAAAVAAGAAPFVLVLLAVHALCFGSPWRTGYSFSPDVAHREGWLGIVGPNRPAFSAILLAPASGLLVLSPWVVLSALGAVAIFRDAEARARIGREAAVAVAVIAGYILLIGSLVPEIARGGWSVGPRYLAVAVPFLGWLAAAGLAAVDGSVVGRTVAHALVLVGVIVHVLAASTYPHWPDSLANPLHELALRVLREGLAPHSLGTLAGLTGPRSLVPLYLAELGLCIVLLGGASRRRVASLAAATLLAAVVVFVGYARLPGSGAEAEGMWRFVRSTWEPLP
jgi:hypothetical protein